jgi:plastocyanin
MRTPRARRAPVAVLAAFATVIVALPMTALTAHAATTTVTITKDGYVPADRNIGTGDTVTFANADTVVHEVEFKQTSGFTCTVSPLVVQPTTAQSCTFTAAGTYTFTDPKDKGTGFRGTLTVTAPVAPAITLASSATVVRYGNQVTLSGAVVPRASGTPVDILALEFGETAYAKVATVSTNGAGAFSYSVAPQLRTTYRAEFTNAGKAITSSEVPVQVRPRVSLALRDLTRLYGYFRTKVVSTLSYEGDRVLVQRRNQTGGWTTLKGVTLGAFSSARFRVRLPSGDSRIRVLVPAAVAGPGYLAGFSRGVLVTR